MAFAHTRTAQPLDYFVPRERQEPRAARTADETLRERLLARLEGCGSWRTDTTNVIVCDGEVTLQGLFTHAADRAASVAIVRAVPGVRAVVDRRVRFSEWQAMA